VPRHRRPRGLGSRRPSSPTRSQQADGAAEVRINAQTVTTPTGAHRVCGNQDSNSSFEGHWGQGWAGPIPQYFVFRWPRGAWRRVASLDWRVKSNWTFSNGIHGKEGS
jgi:hypothetical protein